MRWPWTEKKEVKPNHPTISEAKRHSEAETKFYISQLEKEEVDNFDDLEAEAKRILGMPAELTQQQVESMWEPREKLRR